MVRKSTALLCVMGLATPGMVLALGLGELTLKSYLNEPLRAEVGLLESAGLNPEQVKIRLAGHEDFERSGIERAYFLTSLKFEVELSPNGDGRLLITSPQPVREPFLDFIIEARWPNGRLLREYTLLLDPPVFTGTRTADEQSSGSAVAAQDDGDSGGGAGPSGSSGPSGGSPAPRTSRQYDAEAADQPMAGGKYLVERNETMWAIASQARPAGASVEQTMLDIQRLNPEAFIGNNVNRLKAGYVLRLPTADDISNDNRAEAIAAIALQTERWQAAKEGRRLDASEEAGESGVSSSDDGGGRLQIAGVDEDPTPGGYGSLEQEVTANLENLDRAQRDNADMRARMEAMEDQVATLQRLLALKDDQIAALQGAVSESGEMDEGLAGTIAAIDEEAAEAEAAAAASEETATEPQTAEPDTAAVEQPAPAPQPAPVAAEEGGLIATLMDNLLYVVLGVLLLVALVVVAVRRRASGEEEFDEEFDAPLRQVDGDDEFANVELGDDGLIVDEFQDQDVGADEMGSEPQGFSSEEDMYAARFESGDALAEADIYIAYGRYPQAADVLKSAIAMEPVNTELRLKLMEACAEMAEREEFQQQYADLQLIGDEAALDKARDHLEIVDGGEMWLEDLPNPSITMAEIDAARTRQAEGALKAEPMVEFMSDDEGETEEPVTEEAGTADAGVDAGLDLDLDSDLDDELGMTAGAAAESADDGKLDLDLNLEIEEIKSSSPAAAAGSDQVLNSLDEVDLDAAIEAGTEDATVEMGDLDLEGLDAGTSTQAAGETPLGEMELDDLTSADSDPVSFDASVEPELELADELDGELLTEFGELTIEGEESVGLEQPNLDQSLDELSDSLTAGSESAGLAVEGAQEAGEDTELVFASNGDETATKLDLARAYMDMGDQDGARNILEEVAKVGDDSQKQEAQSLLDSIA